MHDTIANLVILHLFALVVVSHLCAFAAIGYVAGRWVHRFVTSRSMALVVDQ